MYWYQYLSLACLGICFVACLWHFIRLVRLGKPKDLSEKRGNIAKSLFYSYTTAMLPSNKESAYLHIPTFTTGIFLHLGTFLSLVLYIVFFFAVPESFHQWLTIALVAALAVSAVSGFSLFIKRIVSKKLRSLSNPDDYISNLLTTLFQAATILYLIYGSNVALYYYIMVSLLFLYLPVGKLRHVVYFFAARFHLGFFYGWRNTWPIK